MVETTRLSADPSNAEQVRAWDGDEGEYWAARADYFDRSVGPHHERLMATAAIRAADRVLDIGCGCGQTTRDAALAAPRGSALGVDLSSAMLEYARRRAADEGVANAIFEHADAQISPFETGSFDVAISRSGAMFFGDPVAAFANIARGLRPGGRLVLAVWQPPAPNEWFREFGTALAAGRDRPLPPADAPGPFALSDPDTVRTILGGAGFTGTELEGVSEKMWFGRDVDEAHREIGGLLSWMLEGLDDAGRAGALEALRANMATHHTPEGVQYDSAMWLITATRP